MTDPLQPAETRFRVTENVLRICAKYEYPVVISTRSSMVASERYVSLLRDCPSVVQFSFSTLKRSAAQAVEPYCEPPNVLLAAMESLSNASINVTCRWQPYIPGLSESPSRFIPRIAAAGARHIGLEHLKLGVETRARSRAAALTGTSSNLVELYRNAGSHRDGREYVLPSEDKLQTVLCAREMARQHGLTFGAADNDLQHLSDTACCCSGVDQFAGFESWYKYQIGCAVRRSRGRAIKHDLIAGEWRPVGSIDRYLNSRSRLSTRGALALGGAEEHLRRRWNEPDAPSSPASFFGVRPTDRFDSGGYRIYEWTPNALSQ